jgi:hypothetical protein
VPQVAAKVMSKDETAVPQRNTTGSICLILCKQSHRYCKPVYFRYPIIQSLS